MNRTLVAVLLSALVIPGAGHLYLGRKAMGAALLVVSLACLALVMATVFEISQQLSAQILAGKLSLNLADIREAILQQQLDNASGAYKAVGPLLVVCWLIGIVDCIRVARNAKAAKD